MFTNVTTRIEVKKLMNIFKNKLFFFFCFLCVTCWGIKFLIKSLAQLI